MDNETRSIILDVVDDIMSAVDDLEKGMIAILGDGEKPEEARQALRRMVIERLSQSGK